MSNTFYYMVLSQKVTCLAIITPHPYFEKNLNEAGVVYRLFTLIISRSILWIMFYDILFYVISIHNQKGNFSTLTINNRPTYWWLIKKSFAPSIAAIYRWKK